ncbi:MAG: LCP family protein, partial [Christensenellales bacterium]
GFQHMDGQAVLDYLRVRKAGTGLSKNETGDANRVNRQKKMLVAIFQKIKDAGLMTKIPDLLSAFDGQLYTNCTTSQTAALALYGYNMPKENIGMHSMSGSTKNLYTWNFCFPNPKTRREIIKSVYGVDVTDLRDCTKEYATYLYYSKVAEQSLDTCKALTSYVAELIAADDLLPEFTPEPTLPPDVTPGPSDPTPIIIGPDTPTPDPSTGIVDDGAIVDGAGGMRPSLVSGFLSRSVPSDDVRRYSDEQRAVYSAYLAAYDECASALKSANAQAKKYLSGDAGGMSDHEIRLENACDALQSAAELVASTFNYGKTLKWDITPLAKTNEIYVDFR